MTEALPLSHNTNLARLGNAGDKASFCADESQRAALAAWSEVLSVDSFAVTVELKKLAADRFGLSFHLVADIAQACVVTLEPVPARLDHRFSRELHFIAPVRRKPEAQKLAVESDVVLDDIADEGPETIESLHYDLAGPVLEEYVLALEPYPRRPGVEFPPQTTDPAPKESPFAVLKGLK